MKESIKEILKYIVIIAVSAIIPLSFTSTLSGCKTQATIHKDESDVCFNDRYRAREGFPSEIIALECANTDKRKWCYKIIKDEIDLPYDKKTFKDFNDCWSKGK